MSAWRGLRAHDRHLPESCTKSVLARARPGVRLQDMQRPCQGGADGAGGAACAGLVVSAGVRFVSRTGERRGSLPEVPEIHGEGLKPEMPVHGGGLQVSPLSCISLHDIRPGCRP